jgi:hypothetical protein
MAKTVEDIEKEINELTFEKGALIEKERKKKLADKHLVSFKKISIPGDGVSGWEEYALVDKMEEFFYDLNSIFLAEHCESNTQYEIEQLMTKKIEDLDAYIEKVTGLRDKLCEVLKHKGMMY